VITYEWQRLQTIIDKISGKHMTKWQRWNRAVGIIDSDGEIKEIKDPIQVLKMFMESNEDMYLILENFNLYLNNADVIQLLFEISKINRNKNKSLIIESSELMIPEPLAKEIVALNMPLPDK
jgi:DNA-directed RNA polymerase